LGHLPRGEGAVERSCCSKWRAVCGVESTRQSDIELVQPPHAARMTQEHIPQSRLTITTTGETKDERITHGSMQQYISPTHAKMAGASPRYACCPLLRPAQ
jgi:hypothetical protein